MPVSNLDQLSAEQVKRFAEALHKPLMEGLLFGSLVSGGPSSAIINVVERRAEAAAERTKRAEASRWTVERRPIEMPSRAVIG